MITFTQDQIKRLANLVDNASQVFLATIVLPPLFGLNPDQANPLRLTLTGIVGIIVLWWIALRLERLSS